MRRMIWVFLALLSVSVAPVGAVQSPGIPELVNENTAFAIDLYHELEQNTDSNVLFSPYSISQALAMTYAGAEGETERQMAGVLGFTLPEPTLHEAFRVLNAGLIERGTAEESQESFETARELYVANGLWGEQTLPFSLDYTAQLEQSYGAGLQETDFRGAPETAREEINGWVAEQTGGHIQDIVPAGAIKSDMRLVLANAIYFYGRWHTTFDSGSTADDLFFLLNGATVSVPFMVQLATHAYARADGFQIIELPYSGSGLALTVILPDDGTFEAFEEGLDSATLHAAIDQLASTRVRLYLPKFEFSFGSSVAQTLQSMGMIDAFDRDIADFTGMVQETSPEGLYIGEVLHEAFISVDETGTEAAASTVVLMPSTGGPGDTREPIEVRIDRPFIFTIRDTVTGTVLFLGRVMNPNG